MTIRTILTYPDERLHTVATPVTEFNDNLQIIVNDLIETMYSHDNAVGLSATQINVHKRIFVADISGSDVRSDLMVLINPQIVKGDGQEIGDEGCLSVPGIYESVTRYTSITVKFHDRDGKLHEIDCDGFLARCIQHEIDHLNGKVFVDYLSQLKQNFIKKKMKKLHTEG